MLELWLILAILSGAIFALVNIVDKFIVGKYINKSRVIMILVGLVGAISGGVIFLFKFEQLSIGIASLALISGSFQAISYFIYFKALKVEEVSRVAPLFYLSVFFTAIFAALFLGEIFTLWNYTGIMALFSGAILLSYRPAHKKRRISKALFLMVISSLLLAFSIIITKYVLNFTDFWNAFSYARIGFLLVVLPFLVFYFPIFKAALKTNWKEKIGLISLTELIALVAMFASLIAMSIGTATLVNAAGSTQAFFILLYTIVISLFYPRILKEDLSKRIISLKILAISFIFLGIYLIA